MGNYERHLVDAADVNKEILNILTFEANMEMAVVRCLLRGALESAERVRGDADWALLSAYRRFLQGAIQPELVRLAVRAKKEELCKRK